jgi:hypothetical protein
VTNGLWLAARAALVGALTMASVPCHAQDSTSDGNFFSDWEHRASASQAEQPHWVTPLFTTTPRLEQEFRSDILWRTAPSGTQTTIYTNGKGLELIPFSPVELIVGVPAYTVHRNPKDPDGWGDWPLLLKWRFISNNEAHGNDILTGFLGATLPTGGKANGSRWVIFTPTLAAGKGWGDFDVQATAGINLPAGNEADLGHPFLYNATFQYHVSRFVWPEFEVNGTAWRDGENDGRNQVFLTPGLVFGRFPIHDRLGLTVGGGIQIAATTFHQYNHNWTLSVRVPF